MSTTHDWARELQETAAFLLSKPELEIGKVPKTRFYTFSDKDTFIALVRTFKPGIKTIDTYTVNFEPKHAGNFEVAINRDLMCRRLNPEYECTPILSPEEDAEMEAAND